MSTRITTRLDETPDPGESAGVARSEPGGRAQRRAGAARAASRPRGRSSPMRSRRYCLMS